MSSLKQTINSPTVTWFRCNICDILLPTKFKIWSHLLKIHAVHCHKDDKEKTWKEVQLIAEKHLKVAISKTEESIKKLTNKRKKPVENNMRLRTRNNKKLKVEDNTNAQEESETGPELRYKCDKCEKKFKLESFLIRHRLNSHNIRIKSLFYCEKCEKDFYWETLFEYHKLTHEPGWDKMTWKEQNKLKLEKKLAVNNKRMHKCQYCPRKFMYETQLRKHVKMHTNERPYECKTCPATYRNEPMLIKHLNDKKCEQRNAIELNRNFQCELCNQWVKTMKGLQSHKRHQHGMTFPREKKELTCLICGYIATNTGSLRLHDKTHTGEKPYHCVACGATFASNHNMRAHMRMNCIASREKGLDKIIDEQARKISEKKQKTRDSNTVTLEYECNECSLKFHSIARLNTHKKVHGESYFCDICNAGFLHTRGVADHKSRIHNKEFGKIVCDLCQKRFVGREGMKRHYKGVHGLDWKEIGDKLKIKMLNRRLHNKVTPKFRKIQNLEAIEDEEEQEIELDSITFHQVGNNLDALHIPEEEEDVETLHVKMEYNIQEDDDQSVSFTPHHPEPAHSETFQPKSKNIKPQVQTQEVNPHVRKSPHYQLMIFEESSPILHNIIASSSIEIPTLKKKLKDLNLERMRRSELSSLMETVRRLVPGVMRRPKSSKAEILKKTTHYVKHLGFEEIRLIEEEETLRARMDELLDKLQSTNDQGPTTQPRILNTNFNVQKHPNYELMSNTMPQDPLNVNPEFENHDFEFEDVEEMEYPVIVPEVISESEEDSDVEPLSVKTEYNIQDQEFFNEEETVQTF